MGDIIRKLKQKGKINLKWYSNNHSIVIKYTNTRFLNPVWIYFISLVLVNSWKDSGNTLLFIILWFVFSERKFPDANAKYNINSIKLKT